MIDHNLAKRLRDRFFALCVGGDEDEKQRFRDQVNALDPDPTTELQGLSLSFFPTSRFKHVRFVDADHIDEAVRPMFARPCAHLPHLVAAFVDPEEFCYRSFENIVCLDRLFAQVSPSDVRLSRRKSEKTPARSFSVDVSPSLRTVIEQLDELGLYVQPLNAASRGGQRFIFHAADLAAAMTEAVRAALPKQMLNNFSHVNPVFRCNRFEPGDERFHRHVDSPYHDASRHHVSRYTLLWYLTGGRGEAVLKFGDDQVIDDIPAMTAVVFEQRVAHEGGPYADGRKVFLRTELVFEDENLDYEPGIAHLFAKACYLTGESVFAPELARFTHDAYDRVAAAHWRGLNDHAGDEPFVHKRFRRVDFVSNGYDFWFAKGRLSLVECAAITLLDVLNAKVGRKAFRKQCTTKVLVRGDGDAAWIADLVGVSPRSSRRRSRAAKRPVFAELNKRVLFPEPELPASGMGWPSAPEYDDEPFDDDWDATRHPDVIEALERAQEYAMKRIFGAPISIMGQEVFLQPERFLVHSDKIYVLSSESLAPVNFAAVEYFGPSDFIDVDVEVEALQVLVPPILYRETDGMIHLMFDLFRNGWMVEDFQEAVPVPIVLDDRDMASPDLSPWLSSAAKSSDYDTVQAELGIDY